MPLLLHIAAACAFPIAELPQRIRSILAQPAAANVSWGILIHSSQHGELFALNANHSLVPASNTKLLMASAALLVLGSEYRFSTRSFLSTNSMSSPPSITSTSATMPPLAACFQPSGDPSFSDAVLTTLVNATAAALEPAQRTSVTLELALSDTGAVPSSWEYDDLNYDYGALPGPTILNGNVFEVLITPGAKAGAPLVATAIDTHDANVVSLSTSRSVTLDPAATSPLSPELKYGLSELSGHLQLQLRGSMRVGDEPIHVTRAVLPPARLFAAHLVAAANTVGLGAAGGAVSEVAGRCRAAATDRARQASLGGDVDDGGPAPLASVSSAPLLALLNHTLQRSDNTYAEALLRALNRTDSSVGGGLVACRDSLLAAGVAMRGVQHVDGSGLSRHNLVPPATFVSLLHAMAPTPLRTLLPVGGRSGTLKHRFVGTAAEGRVLAKTGTMGGVSGLSGYLLHEDKGIGEVTFSLLGNDGLGYGGLLRPVQDAIVVAVANARAEKDKER